jgi:hypothetical protein
VFTAGYNTYAIKSTCGGSNVSSHPTVTFTLNRFCNGTDFGYFESITINNGTATANSSEYTSDDGCAGVSCELKISSIDLLSFTACSGS